MKVELSKSRLRAMINLSNDNEIVDEAACQQGLEGAALFAQKCARFGVLGHSRSPFLDLLNQAGRIRAQLLETAVRYDRVSSDYKIVLRAVRQFEKRILSLQAFAKDRSIALENPVNRRESLATLCDGLSVNLSQNDDEKAIIDKMMNAGYIQAHSGYPLRQPDNFEIIYSVYQKESGALKNTVLTSAMSKGCKQEMRAVFYDMHVHASLTRENTLTLNESDLEAEVSNLALSSSAKNKRNCWFDALAHSNFMRMKMMQGLLMP